MRVIKIVKKPRVLLQNPDTANGKPDKPQTIDQIRAALLADAKASIRDRDQRDIKAFFSK